MLCECGQHEATIHEVIITNDKKKVERHLCEHCARKQGISSDPYIPINELMSSANYIMGQVLPDLEADIDDSVESDLELEIEEVEIGIDAETYAESNESEIAAKPQVMRTPSPQACLGCGLTFASFKKTGLLGCSACYQLFEDRIGPMIERAHEGGCNHVGKVPKRALCECKDANDTNRIESLLGDIRQREERLETLRAQLAKSIHSEEYEQAAMLRDELTRLTSLSSSSSATATSSQIEVLPGAIQGSELKGSQMKGPEGFPPTTSSQSASS